MKRAMWGFLGLVGPGLAHAEEVAAVLAVDGQAEVIRMNGIFQVTPTLGLDRADVVRTGEDGAVLVLLNNDRVVRIDEDLSLRVGDIVLLGLPRATVPVQAQISDLLYPGERVSMRGIGDAERIAGWHSRLQAGTAVPAQAAPTAQSTADAAKVTRGGAKSGNAGLGISGAGVGGGGSGSGFGYGSGPGASNIATPAPPPPVEPPPPAPTPALTEADVRRILVEEGACVASWRTDAGIPVGAPVIVHVIVEDGHIDRLTGDAGLTPPRCARDRLVGQRYDGASFDVTLP